MRNRLSILAVTLFGSVVYLLAADPPQPNAESLIRDLGSPVFATRDKATRDLWKLGEPARPAVEAATKSDDPEVARRATNILEKFDWGIFPDTPPDVLKQIKEFRSDDMPRQTAAVGALLRQGDRGLKTLRLILGHKFEPEPRGAYFDEVLVTSREIVPGLLFAGKLDEAARVLQLGATGPNPQAWLDYAVFAVQHGRVAEAMKDLDAAARGPAEEARDRYYAKAFLLVVSGQAAAAKTHLVAKVGEQSPLEFLSLVREEMGAWQELIGPDDAVYANDGLRLHCARKAGNKELASALAAKLKRTAVSEVGGIPFENGGIALLLNEMPFDAIAVLRDTKDQPRLLADVLAERLQFGDALGLLGEGGTNRAAEEDPDDRPRMYFDMRRARILAQLGRKDEAVQLFNKLGEQVRGHNTYLMREFLRASLRSGYLDLSAEHAGKFLVQFERRGDDAAFSALPEPFELLFDEDAEAGRAVWKAFRHDGEHREANAPETMRHIREALTGRAGPDKLAAVKKHLDRWQAAQAQPDGGFVERCRTHRALAVLARHAGDDTKTESELRKAVREWGFDGNDKPRTAAVVRELAASTGPAPRAWMYDTNESFKVWLDLGEYLLDHGRPAEAGKTFEQGWRQYPNNPILLYLSGKALRTAGDAAEGDRRMKLAHAVTLGDAQMRGRFLHELTDRGELADVKEEVGWTKKCVWYRTPQRGNVWNQLSRAADLLHDYDGAAAAIERNLYFLLLTPNVVFCDGGGYIRVPTNVRGYRARSALAAGRTAEAFAEAKAVLQLLPGHTEFLTAIVPEFDKREHPSEAKALFEMSWAVLQKLVRENPDSWWALATAAQAAGGCVRELDTALAYATKAVELAPEVRWPQEVLAEAHFRKGDRAAALKVMAGLRKLDARSPYYKRLVERYTSADVTSPVLLAPEVD